jgi:hypothetical protein
LSMAYSMRDSPVGSNSRLELDFDEEHTEDGNVDAEDENDELEDPEDDGEDEHEDDDDEVEAPVAEESASDSDGEPGTLDNPAQA